MISRSLLAAVVVFSGPLFALGAAPPQKGKSDAAAKALAALIKPLGLTPAADPAGLARVRAQVIAILNAMEASEAKGGAGSTDLLHTAYRYYRLDVGSLQSAAAVAAMSDAWRTARALGLFNEKHLFDPKITIGEDAGKPVSFEFIVPLSEAPEFSQDVTNIRLVPPGKARTTPNSVSSRDLAYLATLRAISREVKDMKKGENEESRNSLGQTLTESERIWSEEMARDGEKAQELPHIYATGLAVYLPGKTSDQGWRVHSEVKNLSRHATEVEVHCWVVGSTWKKRDNFLMLAESKKIHLRAGQVDSVEFTTLGSKIIKANADEYEQLDPKKERPRSSVSYRGTVFQVTHTKGVATTFTTLEGLDKMLDGEGAKKMDTLPKLFLDPKATTPKK